MACVVCQHCQGPFTEGDRVAVREGCSYHKKCHKCYVCSETNLHDAEVFKGVIFCCSCSQRIFQGCSTARRTKDMGRSQSARGKKRRQRGRDLGKRPESAKARPNGVLELTRLAASTDSDSSEYKKEQSRLSHTLAMAMELAPQIGKEIYETNSKDLKKNSTEIGMTTEVTQELLRQMNCPVVADRKRTRSKPPRPEKKVYQNGDSRFAMFVVSAREYCIVMLKIESEMLHYRKMLQNQTIICSDLRMAELGASTEIAHMALRKKSEIPVIIHSESGVKEMDSSSLSGPNPDSDVSGDSNAKWLKSSYSTRDSEETQKLQVREHLNIYIEHRCWLDRRIGSILKIPFRFFKRNVLDRSSLISVLTSADDESHALMKKFKMLFREEVTEHQQRGVRRLYSTINRRRTPYKLGWLNLITKVSTVLRPQLTIREQIERPKRCKHFKRSHSYRCMRAQVMRLAGPTKSELACFRNKVKKIIKLSFVKGVIGFNKKYATIMMSQACGSDVHEASPRNAKSK